MIYQETTLEVCETVVSNNWEVDQGSNRNYRSDHDWLEAASVESNNSIMWQSCWYYERQNLRLFWLSAMSGWYQWQTSGSLGKQDPMVFGNVLSQRSESNRRRANGVRVGQFSQNSLHWVFSTRFKRWWRNQSVNQSNSKEGSSSCQCTMTLYGRTRKQRQLYFEFCQKYRVCSKIPWRTLVVSGTRIREEMVWNPS